MPKTTFPRDRFDDLPADTGRVGAHRAEQPRMRGWVVFLWAALATVVLIAVGIFGTLLASGRVVLFPTPSPTATPAPVVTPVVDTSYSVMVLNATPESGLATQMKDVVVAAGWLTDTVTASDAGSEDFAETTVYYAYPEDEAAALGLAQVIGGAAIAQTDVYQPIDTPDAKLLTIVIGLDRTAAGATPAPTP
ncbi:LytR C-terminal domain-containing protein [Microbacterium sp. RU33B]|uniref:LytR C-terminal domain-containing protein n=1 Tax=Microbacterium sp. RU33B TaxID=1907390 RepID=UPI00095E46D3|nr:LytR C-terminal domain-containing protein [Microbacterium sp. RU33B]SIT70047.1 LytR cell envelope-related transcriptional attenuator [Microbacterium sp. RU33B]